MDPMEMRQPNKKQETPAPGPVALLCPEPFRERIQGIGIRFLEMGRELQRHGHEVVLWVPNEDIPSCTDVKTVPLWGPAFRAYLKKSAVVIVHGHISETYFAILKEEKIVSDPPLVVDLYDPFLVENLQYTPLLGEDVFFRDRSVLFRQIVHGDFFLTGSEDQRLFYIGLMLALGRVLPQTYHKDPTLRNLIDTAPFGVHPMDAECVEELPGKLKGTVSGIGPKDLVIFFGGVYEWYDPVLLLEGLRPFVQDGWPVRVVFCSNPNPETTPQRRLAEVRRWADAAGWTGKQVIFIPWFPYQERFRYYKDVDVAVSLHQPSLETELSFRTRLLDFMNAGLPLIITEGGAAARKVQEAGCGRVVRPGNREDLHQALRYYLENPRQRRLDGEAGRRWVQNRMSWSRVLEPLVRFCRSPRKIATLPGSLAPQTESPPLCFSQLLRRTWRHGAAYGLKASLRRAWHLWKVSTRHGASQ